MLLRFILLFVFFSVSIVFASDTLSVTINGFKDVAGVWIPKNVSKNTPVTVWFHGGMSSSRCDKGLEAGKPYFELQKNSIVISPSACQNTHWLTKSNLDAVEALLDSLEKRLKRPIQSVNLVGVSDGCLGVTLYSLYGMRIVKNRLLISGFLKPLGDAKVLSNEQKLQTGQWTFLQGSNDRLYPAAETFPWIETFCKNKYVHCKIHLDPLGEHDWSYWESKRKEWILESAP